LNYYPRRIVFRTNGYHPGQSVKEFQLFPSEKRFRYRLIIGHRTNELLDLVHPDTTIMTVFRDPIDRIVSHYFYVKRLKNHHLHDWVMRENIELQDYVSSRVSDELQNWYTTHFSGLSVEEVNKNPEEALQRAVHIISTRYDIVGFQDELSVAAQKLKNAANLRLPFADRKENKTRERVALSEISVHARRIIGEVNFVDVRLFALLREQMD
jgi:hypothetical protein